MASPEAFLGFRLRFGRSLTTTSLMSVLLSLSDRSVVKLGVSLSTGAVVSADTRPSYFPGPQPPIGSIVALADNPRDTSAPFRMTRNIVSLATPQAVLGVVGGGLTASTRVLQLNTDWLAAYLTVMFRDEVIAVVALAKTSLPSDGEAPALLRRAQNNTTRVLDRVHSMASTAYGPDSPLIQKTPVSPVPGQELLSTPVHNLLLNAMAVKHLTKMPPAWAPWM
jgi:phosphatidylinositol kinase/protein kinase (PI-3  family)